MSGFFVFSAPRLLELREQRGWARERLAAEADLSFGSVIAYEHGLRVPSRASLFRLASALGVQPSELLDPDPDFEAVAQ